jgi:hypothetical protein
MSGKYLHGLIVDGLVDVRDNIFSHSVLRQKWSKDNSEKKHPLIREWSWDYVNRCFVETPTELISIGQKWIDENLSTHQQLIQWVDKNWIGLVCGDEFEREMYIWELISHKAKYKNKKVIAFLKAYADWNKAYADRNKAYADWNKAYADWKKAYADRNKAYADWKKRVLKPVFMELLREYPNDKWA